MHYPPEHLNQDITRRQSKYKDPTAHKNEHRSKVSKQVNPRNWDKDNRSLRTPEISKCNQSSCIWWNIPSKNLLFLLKSDPFFNTTYDEI